MKLHNQMEDLVVRSVQGIFDEEARTGAAGYCVCAQCRLDVACYVLNRTRPAYAVSGRGLARIGSHDPSAVQAQVDLTALVHEGIRQISRRKRPFFDHAGDQEPAAPRGPLFNFPVIRGRLFDGSTFEPMREGEVRLLLDGEEARMVDPNWRNPNILVADPAGVFVFWPHPMPAARLGEERRFASEIVARAPRYEPARRYFEITVTAAEMVVDSPHLDLTHTVEDLFIFRQ